MFCFETDFKSLKKNIWDQSEIQIYVINRHTHHRKSKFSGNVEKTYTYDAHIVHTDEKIQKTLRSAVANQIKKWNDIVPYTNGIQETERSTALCVEAGTTDIKAVISSIETINSQQDENSIFVDPDQLVGTWMYVIRISQYIPEIPDKDLITTPLYAVRRVSDTWNLKKVKRNGRNALMKNGFLTDIGDGPIFTVDKVIDFLSFNETIFVNIKSNFETLLNLRVSMIVKKETVIIELKELDLIDNEKLFSEIVGTKLLPLQKIASIYEKGHYKDAARMEILIQKTKEDGWILQFNDGKKIDLQRYVDNPKHALCMLRELNSERKLDLIDGSESYACATVSIPKSTTNKR